MDTAGPLTIHCSSGNVATVSAVHSGGKIGVAIGFVKSASDEDISEVEAMVKAVMAGCPLETSEVFDGPGCGERASQELRKYLGGGKG